MKRLLLLGAVLLSGCATDVEVKEAKGELKPGDAFPHAAWTKVLQKFSKGGFVNYKALLADRAEFDEYLGYLAKYSPLTNASMFPRREDQFAYYMNAYNAYTMRQVLDRYPLKSVKDVGAVPNAFWISTAWPLGPGETRTLAQIEGLLRDMGEPRIHFAINCASKGCPRLPEEAFEPDRIEEQLAREAKKFVNEDRNVQVEGATVRLSSILKWYKGDFTGWQKAKGQPEDILAYVRGVGRDVPAGAKIEYLDYDWGLNEQAPETGK